MKLFIPSFSFGQFLAASSIFLICIVFSFSCAPVEDPVVTAPVPAFTEGCEPGSELEFELECLPSGQSNPDYVAELVTGPYQSNECLCTVQNYTFVFSNVAPDEVITMLNSNNLPVAFSMFTDGDLTYLVIDNPEDLTDADLTVFIDFQSAPSENVVPTLEDAGGLCIIDNVGGLPTNPTTQTYHAPLKIQEFGGPSGNQLIWKAYIPTSIGMPVGPR